MDGYQRSSFCQSDGCVEVFVNDLAQEVEVRDSKLGDDSPVLTFDQDEWQAFRRAIVAGEF